MIIVIIASIAIPIIALNQNLKNNSKAYRELLGY